MNVKDYPAFPGEFSSGMTMRDWFAGMALGESTREIWSNHKPEDVAKRCFALADAMIVESIKGANP